MIVDAPAAGLLHHARRQIRSVKAAGQRAERDSGKAGAASDIQHVELAGHRFPELVHHGAEHLRSLILQPDRQVLVEAFGIAIEQSPDIGLRHGFSRIAFDAVDQGLDRGRIGRAGVQTAVQGVDRLLPLPQFKPCATQRQLPGGEFRVIRRSSGCRVSTAARGSPDAISASASSTVVSASPASRNKASRKCSIACAC